MAAEKYAAVPQEASEDPQPRKSLRARSALLALAGSLLLCGVGACWLQQRRALPERESFSAAALLRQFEKEPWKGECGLVENETDYVLSPEDQEAFGFSFDHIPTPEMCCAMCQGVPKCQSWTWVKDALPDGCPSQCWLKGGKPVKKKAKKGVVSGLPPPRPAFDTERFAALKASEKAMGGGKVFCWSLMLPFGYEVELIKMQHEMQASIFACDATAVYSNKTVAIAPGVESTFVDVDLTVKFGGDSYTALNTWIFIAIWRQVIKEGWHKTHDWIVKVDPDAVFFTDRLRPVLAKHAGAGYINNCHFGFHGPIEVISSKTVARLGADYNASWDGKSPHECVKGLHFGQWGEDFFFGQCMKRIYKITPELDEDLMCEAHCACDDFIWCTDRGSRVTYHPFKRTDLWKQCMANSMAAFPTIKQVA